MARRFRVVWVERLPGDRLAWSWYEPPRIELSRSRWAMLTPWEREQVFAHEVAHQWRALFGVLGQPLEHFRWLEARAERYSAHYLVTDADIDAARKGGCREVWQFAEAWQCPNAWARQRLELYRVQHGSYECDAAC